MNRNNKNDEAKTSGMKYSASFLPRNKKQAREALQERGLIAIKEKVRQEPGVCFKWFKVYSPGEEADQNLVNFVFWISFSEIKSKNNIIQHRV